MLTFYKSTVRSSVVCLPSDCVESIQKRALRIIYPELSYREALAVAGLERLQERRERIARSFFDKALSPGHKLNHPIPKPRAGMWVMAYGGPTSTHSQHFAHNEQSGH